MHRRPLGLLLLVVVMVVVSQCGPTGTPSLDVSGPNTAFRDGTPIKLRVVATKADGQVGAGTVVITSDVGVVTEELVTLDQFGTASFTFACNVTTNPDCVVDSANLKLLWQTKPTVRLDHAIRLAPKPISTSDGGGGGTVVPTGCVSEKYNRTVTCNATINPGPNVACCQQLGGQIPNCADIFVCDGMRMTRNYLRVLADGGGVPTVLELEFHAPPYRLNFDECMAQKVGVSVKLNGAVMNATTPYTYGYVEPSGEYFSYRNADIEAYRPMEDRECRDNAIDGGVKQGVWHSFPDRFRDGDKGPIYQSVDNSRFFFITLIKP